MKGKMNADQNITTLAATIHNLRCGMSVAGPASKPYLQSVDDDLSKAMSEHAALVAVADAANEMCKLFSGQGKLSSPQVQSLYDEAYANLAAVRGGGQ